jgi:hypothetical protein
MILFNNILTSAARGYPYKGCFSSTARGRSPVYHNGHDNSGNDSPPPPQYNNKSDDLFETLLITGVIDGDEW